MRRSTRRLESLAGAVHRRPVCGRVTGSFRGVDHALNEVQTHFPKAHRPSYHPICVQACAHLACVFLSCCTHMSSGTFLITFQGPLPILPSCLPKAGLSPPSRLQCSMLPSPEEHGPGRATPSAPLQGYFFSTQGSPDALWLHLTSQLTRSFSLSPK